MRTAIRTQIIRFRDLVSKKIWKQWVNFRSNRILVKRNFAIILGVSGVSKRLSLCTVRRSPIGPGGEGKVESKITLVVKD